MLSFSERRESKDGERSTPTKVPWTLPFRVNPPPPGFNPSIGQGRIQGMDQTVPRESKLKSSVSRLTRALFCFFPRSDQEQTLEISTLISQEKIQNWRRQTKTSSQILTRTNSRTSLSSTLNSWAIALFNNSFYFTLYIDMNCNRWRKFEILFQNEANFIFLERDQATVYFLDFKWPWSLRLEVVTVAWFPTGCGTGSDY